MTRVSSSMTPAMQPSSDTKREWTVPVISAPRTRETLPSSHVLPVACWTCTDRTVSRNYLLFERRVANLRVNETKQDVLNDLGVRRACCRCVMLAHRDLPTSRTTKGQIFT
jgi:DNA-directed RNA polymerase subunit N (RpoN/RPB10)